MTKEEIKELFREFAKAYFTDPLGWNDYTSYHRIMAKEVAGTNEDAFDKMFKAFDAYVDSGKTATYHYYD